MTNVNKPVGVVILQISGMRSAESIKKRIRRAMRSTTNGRLLCIIYQLPKRWQPGLNFEQISHLEVMGRPENRSGEFDWEFFGHLAVRGCGDRSGSRKILSEYGVSMYRKRGEKAYSRKAEFAGRTLVNMRLNTHHQVFTRDVANNVWHFPSDSIEQRIIMRLGSLCAWPDECVAIIKSSTESLLDVGSLTMDRDLIGVPTKIDYEWASKQLSLGLTSED